MLSLQSQLCAIRGAFHLCFKGNKQTKEFIGLKVFLTMLVLSLHNPQTCGAQSVWGSLPSIAQLLLPVARRRQFQSREKMTKLECVCIQRRNDWERHQPPRPPLKTRMEEKAKGLCPCMCVCVPLKSPSNSKPRPNCTFARPEKPKCQRARWNTDKPSSLFFFPIYF